MSEQPTGESGDAGPPVAAASSVADRHRIRRVVIVTQLALALVTALVVTVGYRNLEGNIATGARIDHVVEAPTTGAAAAASGASAPDRQPLNILVMGSDTRSGEGNGIDGEGGGGGSDTTILIHVSADRQETYGVSLPRDALVTRPDCTGPDGGTVPGGDLEMFNTAFAVGGPLCTVTMVESLTGVYIDHYLVLDFNGFKEMVDAVEGVEVCIPTEVDDPEHDIFFEPGVQTLTGQDALNYVRERYVLSQTGDIGRMTRQQAFIASMVNKVVSAGTLSRPTRVYSFLSAVTSSITVDDGLDSISQLVDLTLQFADTGLSDIRFVTVPFTTYEPDPNRLVWTPAADTLWKRIKRDRPLGGKLGQQSLSAADSVGTVDGGGGSGNGNGGSGNGNGGSGSGGDGGSDASASDAERVAAGLCT